MSRTIIGLLLAMASILLLHNNKPLIGLPVFVIAMVLMYKKKKE